MPGRTTRRTARKEFAKLPPYKYKPLEKREFRLIHLHPGKPTDPIVVSVETCKLRHDRYMAVSYVWGDTTREHKIYANDMLHYEGPAGEDCYQTARSSVWNGRTVMVWRPDDVIDPTVPTVVDGAAPMTINTCPEKPIGFLRITTSLLNVLLSLRSEESYMAYWVDSLCINQDDPAEKSHQVGEMMDIYGSARKTLACLGQFDEVMELAFMAVQQLSALKGVEDKDLKGLRDLSSLMPQTLVQKKRHPQWHKTEMPIATAWEAFMAFLQLPWFHRIWVVQEIVLSRSISIVTGKQVLAWHGLVDACDVVQRSSFLHALDTARNLVLIPWYLDKQRVGTRLAIDLSMQLSSWDRPKDKREIEDHIVAQLLKVNYFYHVLLRTRGCGASDPRDHVFALMGICKGAGNYAPEVDYTMSMTEVFTRIAYAWHMTPEFGSPLSFLFAVNGSYHSPDIPTWVPDWRRPWNIAPLGDRPEWIWNRSRLKDLEHIVFPDMIASPLVMPLTLTVRGCRLLTIKDVEDVKAPYTWRKRKHAQLINQFSEPYPTTYLTYKDAFKISCEPMDEGGFDFRRPRSEGFWAYRQAKRGRKRLRPLFAGDAAKFRQVPSPLMARISGEHVGILTLNDGASRGRLEPQYNQEELYGNLTGAFRLEQTTVFEKHARSRKWFITDDGFMGLTIDIVQPGDMIVNLFGGDTPHVLRRKGRVNGQEIWGYVGEAYVLGLMQGETEQDMPEELIEDFHIQ